MNTLIPCPTCGRAVEWNQSSTWRPFCSERCKLIDLGAWASEGRSIPGENVDTEAEPESGEPESG